MDDFVKEEIKRNRKAIKEDWRELRNFKTDRQLDLPRPEMFKQPLQGSIVIDLDKEYDFSMKPFVMRYLSELISRYEKIASNTEEKTEKLNPSTVYYNGDIITMVGDSPNYVESIVEKDGKIIFTGCSEEAMKIAGKGHNMINLEGKTLVPGLIDGHAHFAYSTALVSLITVTLIWPG